MPELGRSRGVSAVSSLRYNLALHALLEASLTPTWVRMSVVAGGGCSCGRSTAAPGLLGDVEDVEMSALPSMDPQGYMVSVIPGVRPS